MLYVRHSMYLGLSLAEIGLKRYAYTSLRPLFSRHRREDGEETRSSAACVSNDTLLSVGRKEMGGHGTPLSYTCCNAGIVPGCQTVGRRRRRAVHDLVGMPKTSGGATRPGQVRQDAVE